MNASDDRPSERVRRRRDGAISQARSLRRKATTPERVLWGILRNGRLAGLKFRRQHPIGPYVADFYCAAAKLIVEVDGESHEHKQQSDSLRTRHLESHGLKVLRVTNEDVCDHLDAVGIAIARAAGKDPRELFGKPPVSPADRIDERSGDRPAS
ncbi:MAG: DUF559 domain-containing protein [Planctomycetaceae bacterium]